MGKGSRSTEETYWRRLRLLLKREGWFSIKTWGGPYQRPGLPDILVVANGRAVFLELKRPGNRPTELQEATMAELELAGALVRVVYTDEPPTAVVEWIRSRTKERPS